MLKNKSNTSIVQVPSVATIKIVPSDNNVLVLLDLDGDVCLCCPIIYGCS